MNKFRSARLAQGKKQKDVADELGCTQVTVSFIERCDLPLPRSPFVPKYEKLIEEWSNSAS